MLSGRTPGIPLSEEGQRQAAAVARALAGEPIAAVHSSPVQRARETAAAVAQASGCPFTVAEALDEIDFGAWTGRAFADLAAEPEWARWNGARSEALPPRGESMAAAQARALGHLRHAAHGCPGGTIVMVSHCDIIRAIVAGVLGLSLDNILRFDVDPASVTRIAAGSWGERLVSLNERLF